MCRNVQCVAVISELEMSDVALFDSVAEDGQHIQSKWKRRKSFLAERDDVTSEMLRSHDNVRRPRASSTVNAENEWQAKNAEITSRAINVSHC